MSIDDIIFTSNLPSLDLHAFDSDTARVCINDFIRDNKILRNEFLIIIHGNGSGVLRKVTNEVLKNNKDVIEYKLAFNNIGCTIVKININKLKE
ncbi:MAG: Smr/MutS family protein [Clostridium sp.]|nr:Smr/MutS family protein [Clostridium sp.]MCM1444066.1 Smr/MutS family protein [Candidatus Amulumruptor caecigallinarius]